MMCVLIRLFSKVGQLSVCSISVTELVLWYLLQVYLAHVAALLCSGLSQVGVFEILYVGPRRSCCIIALVLRVMSKLFLLLFLNLPLGFQINHKKYEKALVAQI